MAVKSAIAAALVAAFAFTGVARAEDQPKQAAADKQTKQLLLLMDQDRNGKVSKQEFMTFMEAEFAWLDVNHDGSLDVEELTGLRVRRGNQTHHK